MENGKHTPGPWEEAIDPDLEICTIHGVSRRPSEDGLGRSYIGIVPKGNTHHAATEEEVDANARLIAAAPDMKTAIGDALRDINDVLRAWDQPASKEQLEATASDLRSILAKAMTSEGEAA
jgi:hypothetical protein